MAFIDKDIISYFSFNKKNTLGGKIIPFKGTVIKVDSGSSIVSAGIFKINAGKIRSFSKVECGIRLKKNSKIIVHGDFSLFYGCDILLFENAVLEFNSGYINSNCFIACSKHISVGKNATIARGVYIYDSDYHELYNGDIILNEPKEVIIEDDVWIGANSTILKGVRLGRGSVVAAGSVVVNDVAPFCMVAGVPAKVIKENVNWR